MSWQTVGQQMRLRERRGSASAGETEFLTRQWRKVVSLAFLKTAVRRRANAEWREDIIRRRQGNRSFRAPSEGEVPRIPEELRRSPKELASRFFQLASGHAMVAPFIREKFGWIGSDQCWWCSSGRQTREHPFNNCVMWEREIRELWKKVGVISGVCRDDNYVVRKGKKGFILGGTKGGARWTRRPGNTSVGILCRIKIY